LCQWLSRWHRGGVYDGEEPKRADYAASLPPFLLEECLGPALARGGEAVVMAEEWQTADALVGLHHRLRQAGLRERAALLWNANNVFGFDRVPWAALRAAATLTTVSRLMRHRMEPWGVRPLVISNGLPAEAYELPDRAALLELNEAVAGRTALVKVARWDPDKDWLAALRSVAHMRDAGLRPLLIARGGQEPHEAEVREEAGRLGLRWVDREPAQRGLRALLDVLREPGDREILCLRFPLDSACTRALFRAADAVLANSAFEPFGLVGLETMAVGGIACTGLSGEDYAIPGRNAIVIQSHDPAELTAQLRYLKAHPDEELALRRAARQTAMRYAWVEVVRRTLLPRVALLRASAPPPRSAPVALEKGGDT
jgi:glycosyltransferase involved in cell wall biosynthesis